jgi:hypothetical protein
MQRAWVLDSPRRRGIVSLPALGAERVIAHGERLARSAGHGGSGEFVSSLWKQKHVSPTYEVLAMSGVCARVAPLACAVFCAAPAMAGMIDQSSLPNGANMAMLMDDGVNIAVSSTGGNFKKKTVNGIQATGISGGAVDGEIDNEEMMHFEFDQAVTITSISIAHLFTDGEFNDNGNEIAAFLVAETMGGMDVVFQLEATTDTTGTWSGLGSVTNDSIATEAGGGAWTVSGADIFGQQVVSLKLVSGNAGTQARFGDYGFRSLSFIPTPATAGLFAAAGMCAMRRRRA